MLARQDGLCAVCGESKERLCVDHEHVRGWRQMPADRRRLYVRCLACTFCNRRLIARGMTLERARRIVAMFESYEGRRP